MNEVTRTEFDGLGGRVTELREQFVTFKAAKEVVLTQLAEAIQHQADNDTRLFGAQDTIRSDISAMKGRLIGIGIALGVGIPVIMSLILFIFRTSLIGG